MTAIRAWYPRAVTDPATVPTTQHAVRVLLLDEADRVLLVRFRDGGRSWWCTPGGGLEPGESEEEAGRREVREELGADAIEFGPCIWTRRHVGVFRGRPFDQSERIYLARTPAFSPRPTPAALREHGPDDIRWWTLEELGTSGQDVAPRWLVSLARQVIDHGPPPAPIDVGL